ncbi:MAG: phasin family protein [Pseudomonadales bacterium]|nr:phasin family protein [Pseudomonadales bacterium]
MNIIERQTELGKSLYEINTQTLKEFANLQKANIEKYIELNKAFGEKLPEVKDLTAFFELQKEYGETLATNVKESFKSQSDLFKSAFEETQEAVKIAFAPEAEASEKPKTKSKAKAKAKKTPAVEAEAA